MISLDRPKTGRFSGRFSGLFTSSPVLPGGYDEGRNVFAQGWGLQSVISCSLKRVVISDWGVRFVTCFLHIHFAYVYLWWFMEKFMVQFLVLL